MIPGSEIPKWFSHQNVGGSVNLQVPSDLLGNRSIRIAACAIFVFRKHHPLHQLHIQDYGDYIGAHKLQCSIGGSQTSVGIILSEEFGKIESYQLWFALFWHTLERSGKKYWIKSTLMDSARLKLNLNLKAQAWRLRNVGPIWYSSETLKT